MSTQTNTHTQNSLKTNATTMLVMLFVINFLNFFDRMIPSVVLEPIRKEFNLDDTQLGMLATAFTLIYAVAGLPLGRLADRANRIYVLSGGVFVWSLMTAASGAATNYTTFLLARLGVGVGEASCAPASNSMIGDMYPSKQRARALGLFMLGLPLGSLACLFIVGNLAQQYGWRVPFYIAAVPGFIIALLVLFLRDPIRGAQESYKADSTPIDKPFLRVMSIPTLWWIILSGAAVNFAAYALNTFLPSLMVRYHNVNVAQAGSYSAIVLGVTGLLGLTLGGWLADKLHQRFSSGRLIAGSISLLIAAPLLWFGLTRPAGDVTGSTLLLSAGWLLYFMYFVTVYSSVQDVVEPRLRATAMSVYFFFQYVLGAGFSGVVTGMLSDHFAKQAMHTAGVSEMTSAFRAIGLQGSLSTIVPISILITSVALWFASRSFIKDAAKVNRK